jgi:hypothetical protein
MKSWHPSQSARVVRMKNLTKNQGQFHAWYDPGLKALRV